MPQYRNRFDPRRVRPQLQMALAPVTTPTIEWVSAHVFFTFDVRLELREGFDLASIMGCFAGDSDEPGEISSIELSEDGYTLDVTLGFNIVTKHGMVWFLYNQQAIVPTDGRVIDPTPWAAPVT